MAGVQDVQVHHRGHRFGRHRQGRTRKSLHRADLPRIPSEEANVEGADESGSDAHRLLVKNQFDLILMEFDLTPRTDAERPSESHFSISARWSGPGLVRELRAAQVASPVLVYTVFEGEPYETASLDAGADDFIVKRPPISVLLSRLHAHLRRRERDLGLADKAQRRVRIGRFTIDRQACILLADEKPVLLSNREIKLLEKLGASVCARRWRNTD